MPDRLRLLTRCLSIGAIALAAMQGAAAAVDVDALWDYARPAVSEQRFRESLASASGDDALVLRTQLARSLGLQKRYDAAMAELDALEPQLERAAGPEPRVRAWLERGRVFRSSGREREAEPWFRRAMEVAERERLESLAGDAIHMVALVQPTLEGQLEWNRRVVAYARAAKDERARGWEGPALNNMGVALNQAGRHEEALSVLREAQAAYEQRSSAARVRIARWMVANTLRRLGRTDEALALQLALEAEHRAAGSRDHYVFDELALLYEARGEAERATHYRQLSEAARKGS